MAHFALGRSFFAKYIEEMELETLPLDDMDRRVEDKGAELMSWAWSSDRVGWARLTVIETKAGFRVANWAAFPRFDVDAPLCQAELIEVKGKLFLLVLDALQAEGSRGHEAELRALGEGLRHAVPVESRPAWADGFITPEAVWSRAGTAPALAEGIEAFRRYMDASVRWLAAPRDDRVNPRRRLYQAMRRRFLDNEPSRPFMTKTFGATWSEAYMEGFLFPEAARLEARICGVQEQRVC